EPLGPRGEPRYTASYLAPWAPLETTQTTLRFGSRLAFGAGKMVLLEGDALPSGRAAAVPTRTWVEVLVGAPGDIAGFWVDGGEQLGSELPARGAEVSEVMLRPDGGISFLVRPQRVLARHAMPGGGQPWSFYHLSFHFAGPEGKRLTIRVRPG
ncbi:MAG TPA: hypothetical protein VGV61_08320, partial [Thermoanaerobaculia bacterium]|nr:hypothetical protein [Thermoanaerobaculia bacterium]